MGFLDNSGDIILDAVLTDSGRKRLARGDGSFNVAKFALADDEINYALYDKNHASGSAYYDIEILQTPVLEAFTNNTSTMKSKLITISRTNILYLPVIKLNTSGASISGMSETTKHATGVHLVVVDKDTQDIGSLYAEKGVINGYDLTNNTNFIAFDQGIDNEEAIKTIQIDPDLMETQYIIQLDHRLGSIAAADTSGNVANYSFLDDDNIATYYVTMAAGGQNSGYVSKMDPGDDNNSVLAGKRGTRLQFAIKASEGLTQSAFLFEKLGTVTPSSGNGNITNGVVHYILDTTVRIMGATTGYALELPIRFVKYKSGTAA